MVQEASLLNGISEIEEIQDSIDQSFNSFKNFEVGFSPPFDHHFIIYPRPIDRHFLSGLRRLKADDQAIQLKNRLDQEWEILRDNLPKSIFVRAYEARRQLMRVLVIGLKGTPSAYDLFFFDIFFPQNYPLKPPIIFNHYNNSIFSLDLDLSYNNVSNGCLKFRWDPQTSNICHVLEVIQGYILRFNNDEEQFLKSHQVLLRLLRSPLDGFENFVLGYFRKFAHDILMNMRLKGNLGESEAKTELFIKLLEGFEENGLYCKHLLHGIERRITNFPQQKINGDLINDGVFKCAFSMTKGFVCWFCNDNVYNYVY